MKGAWFALGLTLFAGMATGVGGMLLIGVIDNLIPEGENPHETHSEEERAPLHDVSAPTPVHGVAVADGGTTPLGLHDHSAAHRKLMRMGLFTALAIGPPQLS